MTVDVHRVPSTTGQFDSDISQHVEVRKNSRLFRSKFSRFAKGNTLLSSRSEPPGKERPKLMEWTFDKNRKAWNRETKSLFQFGANLADQNVAAKNAKAISDGKCVSHVQIRLEFLYARKGASFSQKF